MWMLGDEEDGDELDAILASGSESDTESESEGESGSEAVFQSTYRLQDGELEYTCSPAADASPDLSDVSGSPLAKYFDPSTSLLLEEVLQPPSPVLAAWEMRMEVRIREGRGLRAWIDWAVDSVVGRVQKAVEEK